MKFKISDDLDFVTYQADPTDEVYGWFERGGRIVADSGGWWRTQSQEAAAKSAELVAQLRYTNAAKDGR
jgi:hypothetical protein